MAELTTLEEKLSEVLGLAQAAQDATVKVEGLVEDEETARVAAEIADEERSMAARLESAFDAAVEASLREVAATWDRTMREEMA